MNLKKINELIHNFVVVPVVIFIVLISIYILGLGLILKVFVPLFLIGLIILIIPGLIRRKRFRKEYILFQSKSNFNLNEYINLAYSALNAHDFKRADFLFSDIIEKYPTKPAGYCGMGFLELEKEDLEKAKFYFEKTIGLDANYELAKKQLDLIKQERGMYNATK